MILGQSASWILEAKGWFESNINSIPFQAHHLTKTIMNIAPTVGRVVYYKSRGSLDGKYPPTDRAAIVTDVQDTGLENPHEVRLCVLNPEGMFFTPFLEQGQAPGQWDWMSFQKDQQARLKD